MKDNPQLESKIIGVKVYNQNQFLMLMAHFDSKQWINYNSLESPKKGIFPCTFEYKDMYQVHLKEKGYLMVDFEDFYKVCFDISRIPIPSQSASIETVEQACLKFQQKHDFYKGGLSELDLFKAGAQWQSNSQQQVDNNVMDVFKWLLGYNDFPEREEGLGAYYWRTHLRKKLSEIGIEITHWQPLPNKPQ